MFFASSQQTVGTNNGTNTSTGWPAPFGNWYKNAKHQFLFTAAELQAGGFIGGKITELAWETTANNGATSTFQSFTIKMGCTSASSINTWQSGLTTVFSPQNINVVLGWNTQVLTTAYEWDGISNLIVEICYDNLNSSYTYNWATPYTNTNFNSCVYFYSDIANACTSTTQAFNSPSTMRPVTRFTTCPTIPDPNNFSYQWTPSTFLSNSNSIDPYALPIVTTTYELVVTDLNGGCTDTNSVTIGVLCDTCIAPIPTITPVTCYGGNDGAVIAQPGGIDGPPWTLQLLDPITTATILSDTNVITTTTFTGLTAGDYIVRSIDTTGCYADTLINIPQPPQMTLTVSNDTIICIGGSAVLTATGSGGITPYSYNWVGITGNGPHAVSPAISNYYVVNAIDSLGCTSAVDSILVAINPPILISPSAEDTVCPGDMGTLSVLANGGQGGTYNYIWTDAQGGQVGNSSSLDIIPGSGPSVYYVSVTDNCETPATMDSLSIHWYQEPQVNFLTTGNTGCYPVEAAFTNSTPSNQVLSCLWNFGDGSSSAVCGTVDHLYNTPGSYSVSLTVTSPEGCVNDTTMVDIVEVYDYPTAQFDASPNPADVLNPEVDFQDLSSLDVVGFDWSFMDGNSLLGTSSQQNPTYVFPDNAPGVYEVELIVVNADGCEDEISLQVVVNGVFTCYVPTAFTPDGDGLNDLFYVEGESIDVTNFTFRVFNRWGEKVFETDDINSSWDGRYKNAPAQQDIYIWKVETKDVVTGELKEFMGHVTLMR